MHAVTSALPLLMVRPLLLHQRFQFFFWFRFFTRFLCFLTAFYIPFVFPEFQRENFFGAFCGDTAVQPVVLSRSGTENPFGSTFCYGTDQVIVEVSRVISKASNSRQKN